MVAEAPRWTPWLLQTCHVTRPSLGRLLGCGTKDKKYPAQPPRYSGDAQPGADADLLATEGGWRQNLYLYYVILVDNQRGSDLKCGFPLHSDYFGSKEI